jgi:hypothetical protein
MSGGGEGGGGGCRNVRGQFSKIVVAMKSFLVILFLFLHSFFFMLKELSLSFFLSFFLSYTLSNSRSLSLSPLS